MLEILFNKAAGLQVLALTASTPPLLRPSPMILGKNKYTSTSAKNCCLLKAETFLQNIISKSFFETTCFDVYLILDIKKF